MDIGWNCSNPALSVKFIAVLIYDWRLIYVRNSMGMIGRIGIAHSF